VIQSKLVRENPADIKRWLTIVNKMLLDETNLSIPELTVNLEGQRNIELTWQKSVENLASIHLNFRFGKFDPIKINRLPSGDVNVPDGQHRLIAIQYLWKELIDQKIKVPYYAQYTKYLFHNERTIPGFNIQEAIETLAETQKTINRGTTKINIEKVLTNV
jgi:hypothetical protein